MLQLSAFAQTTKDYERAMGSFVKFYNNSQSDSIINLSAPEYRAHNMWTSELIASSQKEYGTIKSYRYIGIDTSDPGKVAVFKMVLTKAGVKASSLTLDKRNYIGTFRFFTSSDEIEKMLKRSKP
jgi:hypothetical protein